MTFEPVANRRAVPRAAIAVVLGVLLVAVAAAPATAAPRPRRRVEPVAARQLGMLPTPVRASRQVTGARPLGAAPSLLADRVAAFVEQRRAVLDSPGRDTAELGTSGVERGRPDLPRPVARLARSAPFRPVDEESLLRKRLADTFRPELARAGEHAAGVLDALEAATSWRSWNHLRGELGRTPDRAARAMELLVRGILSGGHPVEDRA